MPNMTPPTQAELDARDAARSAGRQMAGQGHPGTPDDAAQDSPGPLVAAPVVILRADEDAPAAPPPPAAPAAEPVRLRDVVPDTVRAVQLVQAHGGTGYGAPHRQPVQTTGQRVSWTMHGLDCSADFTDPTKARAFQLDLASLPSLSGAPHLHDMDATPAPDSSAPTGDTDPSGTTGPETDESAVRPENEGSRRIGWQHLRLDMDELLKGALIGFAEHQYNRANVWRWSALFGWLVALVFGAAAVALAVALRSYL